MFIKSVFCKLTKISNSTETPILFNKAKKKDLLIATGDGGNAPGTCADPATSALGAEIGAEFLGVVELDTGAELGTLTG